MPLIRSSLVVLCSGVLLGSSVAANAALIDRGAGLIYDSDWDITWLANTNYGAGSTFDDGVNTTDGLMTWQSAVGWAADLDYFDTIRGVTYDDWRLPITVQPDAGCSQQEGGGAFAAGTGCTASELGHMFYAELGGTALTSISTSADPDLALFTNLQSNGYWSDTSFDSIFAWVVNYEYGAQAPDNKMLGYYAWAVRDGDVAAIPEPGTAWLMGTGLLMLCLGRSRR